MDVLELTKELVSRPSVTPDDAGCQKLLAEILSGSGFKIEELKIGEVDNLWAVHGEGAPLFCFLGHTDVVPTGPESSWTYKPFIPTEENGFLYGRGAADMKGCIAAYIKAALEFVQENPKHKGSLAVLLTSDEEGPGVNGTAAVIKTFQECNIKIDYCLVGEPSSEDNLADVIKVGRRGSLHGLLTVNGIQGHVAYPQLASNPVHKSLPALTELAGIHWDQGNDYFPPTSFQISNLKAGTGADNVIPGTFELLFNFRFSSEQTPDSLKTRVREILDKHGLNYSIEWRLSGLPFLTPSGKLINCTVEAIEKITGSKPQLSTAGGTSDGRFVAPTGAEVVELGLINRTIHKADEHIEIAHLEKLKNIYKLLTAKILS